MLTQMLLSVPRQFPCSPRRAADSETFLTGFGFGSSLCLVEGASQTHAAATQARRVTLKRASRAGTQAFLPMHSELQDKDCATAFSMLAQALQHVLSALKLLSVSAKMAAVTLNPLGDLKWLAICSLWLSRAKRGSLWNPSMLLQASPVGGTPEQHFQEVSRVRTQPQRVYEVKPGEGQSQNPQEGLATSHHGGERGINVTPDFPFHYAEAPVQGIRWTHLPFLCCLCLFWVSL